MTNTTLVMYAVLVLTPLLASVQQRANVKWPKIATVAGKRTSPASPSLGGSLRRRDTAWWPSASV